jgi:hypothetical protein
MTRLAEIKNEIVEKIEEAIDRDKLMGKLKGADYYSEDDTDEYESTVVEFLTSDQNGQFMVPMMIKSFGIEVENEIVEQEGFWDWVTYELFPVMEKAIDIPGMYVEFCEGGIAVMHQREKIEQEED